MNKALSIELVLNLPCTADIADSQRWILTAMKKHGELLIQVLWRVLGNESDVCDAYQETFLKLSGNNLIPESGKVRAYLLRTGTNAAIDILRKRRKHQNLQNELAKGISEGYLAEASTDFDMSNLVNELRTKLCQLPECLQQVIMLRDLGQMPYNQVADVLGVTIETARVYRRRAIIMLSEMMEDNNK